MDKFNAADFLAALFVPALKGESPTTSAPAEPALNAPTIETAFLPEVQATDATTPLVDEWRDELSLETPNTVRLLCAKPTYGGEWAEDVAPLAELALSLTPSDLPPVSFPFGPATIVTDREKFLRWLQADIRRGPRGPRAMYGALQHDLRRLRDVVNHTEQDI